TNCSADARISSSVAGGSKLARVLMFRHMRMNPQTMIVRRPSLRVTAGAPLLLLDVNVLFQPSHFRLVHIFADLATELVHRSVRPVLLELAQHSGSHPRDRQNLGVSGGV